MYSTTGEQLFEPIQSKIFTYLAEGGVTDNGTSKAS